MTHTWITCYQCSTIFAMADNIEKSARQNEDISFFCPHGHSQHYPKGKTKYEKEKERADKLERDLQRKIQNEAYLEDQIKTAKAQTSAYKGNITKIKKRVGNGVCPCCNRHFANLERHMKHQHSDYNTEAA